MDKQAKPETKAKEQQAKPETKATPNNCAYDEIKVVGGEEIATKRTVVITPSEAKLLNKYLKGSFIYKKAKTQPKGLK